MLRNKIAPHSSVQCIDRVVYKLPTENPVNLLQFKLLDKNQLIISSKHNTIDNKDKILLHDIYRFE